MRVVLVYERKGGFPFTGSNPFVGGIEVEAPLLADEAGEMRVFSAAAITMEDAFFYHAARQRQMTYLAMPVALMHNACNKHISGVRVCQQ